MWDMWWQILWIILVTAFVSLLAYYLIRIMGGGARWKNGATRNLRIIEAISVGTGASVQLVKAGSAYLVIGVSRTGITALGTLTADEVTEV
jgi:flagellar protein FliO/FliZ